jgi:hypothetical protein
MWETYASMDMNDNAAKWLQIYKRKHGLGEWSTFVQAVESKFGTNDYKEALAQILECDLRAEEARDSEGKEKIGARGSAGGGCDEREAGRVGLLQGSRRRHSELSVRVSSRFTRLGSRAHGVSW